MEKENYTLKQKIFNQVSSTNKNLQNSVSKIHNDDDNENNDILEEVDYELKFKKISIKLEMLENRMSYFDCLHNENYEQIMRDFADKDDYYCYCGGKSLTYYKDRIKREVLDNFLPKIEPIVFEKLFFCNPSDELNQKYLKLKNDYLLKIDNKSFHKSITDNGHQTLLNELNPKTYTQKPKKDPTDQTSFLNLNKQLFKIASNSQTNIINTENNEDGDEELQDKQQLINNLTEDLHKMILVSQNNKIDNKTLRSNFIKSNFFKQILFNYQSVLNYVSDLESKIESFAKSIIEIEWLRKKELEELVQKEYIGKFILNFLISFRKKRSL